MTIADNLFLFMVDRGVKVGTLVRELEPERMAPGRVVAVLRDGDDPTLAELVMLTHALGIEPSEVFSA